MKAPPSERLRALLPDLWDLVRTRRGALALGLVLMTVNRVCGLVLPASTKFLIDDVIGKRQLERLGPLVGAVLAATLIQGVSSFALTQILSKAAQRLIAEMRTKVQAHVGRLPVTYYDAHKTGQLVSRIMNDVEGVRNLVGTGLVEFLGGLLTAALALLVMLSISPGMTAVTFAALLVFGGALLYAFKTLRPIFKERSKIYGEVTGRLTESLGGVRVVKGYHAENREAEVFATGVSRLLDNVLKTLTSTSSMSLASSVMLGVVGAAIMYVGTREILAGHLTVGGFFTYTMFLGFLVGPMFQIVSIGTQLTEAMAGLERTREVLRERPEDADPARVLSLPRVDGEVWFEDVVFSYEAGKTVLHGVSFHSAPGTVTALVGPSGAGKSTIIGLVTAFHTPSAGRVLVDGVDLCTEDEVLHACRIARVDEFAEGFPEGYETVVGERGVKLSGGQKQRVSIARAVLADPRILILDEATSSLDSESEALIQEGLKHLLKGRTTFVIAHRLSTIRRADQILVVEQGKIVERGTHAELYAHAGRYFEMYTRQHGLEKNLFLAPGEGDLVDEPEVVAAPVQAGRPGLLGS